MTKTLLPEESAFPRCAAPGDYEYEGLTAKQLFYKDILCAMLANPNIDQTGVAGGAKLAEMALRMTNIAFDVYNEGQ